MAVQDDLKLILRRSGKYAFFYDIRSGAAGELADGLGLLRLPKRVNDFEQRLIKSGFVSGSSADSCRGFFRELRSGKPETSVELILCCDGRECRYHLDSTTIFEAGKPKRAIITLYDCSSVGERDSAQLLESAARDSMTGLLNHKAMEQRVEALLNSSAAASSKAMLMIDVDNFKTINDTLGHQRGDEALVRAAGIIKGAFRDGDLVGRIGGDEFMVFVSGKIDLLSARRKAGSLLSALNFFVDGIQLTVSIGATVSAGKTSFKKMYGEADKALYDAKRSGKNAVCFYPC